MLAYFKGTEKNLKSTVFPVKKYKIFTHLSRSVSVSHAQKVEKLHVFGA
jgi:hypothetical protein